MEEGAQPEGVASYTIDLHGQADIKRGPPSKERRESLTEAPRACEDIDDWNGAHGDPDPLVLITRRGKKNQERQ
jgi:hypothetical protein